MGTTSEGSRSNIDLIDGYRRDQVRRNLERSTIDGRCSRLRLFARWLDAPILEADRHRIETFLDGRHLGAKARYRWISDLGCFYQWCLFEEIPGATNPTLKIQRPKLKPGLPRPAESADIEMALRLASPTLRAMIFLEHLAGARAIEVARLQRSDVRETLAEPVIVLHGKGSKSRIVPLHPDLLKALRDLPMRSRGAVFRGRTGAPLTPAQVTARVNYWLHGLGITSTGHQLRAWFATNYYAQTRDIIGTQELLGHASIETTRLYTKWVPTPERADGVRRLSLRPPEHAEPAGSTVAP